MTAVCGVCPHACELEEGRTGFCGARTNRNGAVVCENYGRVTSLALDPIEKKPLRRFHPGGRILSVGSYGCNLRCPFCQNYEISMAGREGAETTVISPEALAARAAELKSRGNIGLAFTYNEPLIAPEYVRDCAALNRKNGLVNVVVTNGYVNEKPLLELLPLIDAMNIDLKGFTEAFYRRLGGGLEPVRRTIETAARRCHVEVTTLIVPGENDSPGEMDRLSAWLSGIDPDLALHVTRFFPRYRMTDRGPTPVETVYALAAVARRHLRWVFEGNC